MSSIVAPEYFTNFGTTTVNGGAGGVSTTLNPSDTSLYVPTAGLTLLPSSTPFRLLIGTPVSGSGEIVKVTAAGSNPLTIVRAQEGTSAGTWIVGTNVQVMLTAGQLTNVETLLQLLNQSSVATPASSATITTSNIGVARVNPSGNVTGIILQSGTYAGQAVTVLNESSNTLTMAASGTSHVADGTSDIIGALTAKDFVWDTGTSLWYPTAAVGGASTSDHYIVGQGSGDTDLTNKTVIPGLAGSADIRAGGTNDWEFDSSTLTGWSTFAGGGAVSAYDANTTALSNLFVNVATSGGSFREGGLIHAVVPSAPFTITAKVTDSNCNFVVGQSVGLFVSDSSSAAGQSVAIVATTGGGTTLNIEGVSATNLATLAGASSTSALGVVTPPFYLRIVVHSAGNVDVLASTGGLIWSTVHTGYSNMTTAGYFGVCLDTSGGAAQALFDWIRFT